MFHSDPLSLSNTSWRCRSVVTDTPHPPGPFKPQDDSSLLYLTVLIGWISISKGFL